MVFFDTLFSTKVELNNFREDFAGGKKKPTFFYSPKKINFFYNNKTLFCQSLLKTAPPPYIPLPDVKRFKGENCDISLFRISYSRWNERKHFRTPFGRCWQQLNIMFLPHFSFTDPHFVVFFDPPKGHRGRRGSFSHFKLFISSIFSSSSLWGHFCCILEPTKKFGPWPRGHVWVCPQIVCIPYFRIPHNSHTMHP